MAHPSLARNPVSFSGVWLTTVSAVAFIVFYLADWFGLLQNPYAGLFGFVLLPGLVLCGLLLIPLGVWREGRRRRHGQAAWAWPALDLNRSNIRRAVVIVAVLTLVNLGIVSLAGLGAAHYMETNEFCGQVCHEPMRPEFTANKVSSHASVGCVQCHIAPGAEGMVRAKMNGSRQAFEMVTRAFPRPIPSAPARDIPAAEGTCLQCHSRGRVQAEITRVTHEYADDEANTDTATTLVMYTGRIHWHARADVKLEYVTTDPKREKIPYIKVTNPDGSLTEYFADGVKAVPSGTARKMDCLDCHSRPAHTFAPSAERAVDDAITNGWIKRSPPFARKEIVAALSAHADETAAEADSQGSATYTSYASCRRTRSRPPQPP